MSEAAYKVLIHRRACDELESLATEHDTEKFKGRLRDAAGCRQPKTHACVENLAGYAGFFYVKGDGLRAICELVKPNLRVLLVDKRRVVYDRIETAIQRADDDAGGVI